MLKGNVAQLITKLLKQELKFEEAQISELGESSLHERILSGGLLTFQRFIANSSRKQANVSTIVFNEGILDQLILVILNKNSLRGPLSNGLSLIDNFLDDSKFRADVLTRLLGEPKLPKILNELLEDYKDDSEIKSKVTKLLLELLKESSEFSAQIGLKNLINSSLKDSKALFKKNLVEDAENDVFLIQNIRTLSALTELEQNIEIIIEEGGVELIVNIIKKQNNEHSAVVVKTSESPIMINLSLKDEDTTEIETTGSEKITLEALNFLNSIMNNPFNIEKLTKEQVYEILKILENINDENMIKKCLDLLEKICEHSEEFALLLSENGCVDKVMAVSNKFPTNQNIKIGVGNILNKLGAAGLILSIAQQIIELGEIFDLQNQEIVNNFISANVYLSNLLTTPGFNQEFPVEELHNLLATIEKILLITINSGNNDLLAAQAIVILRLADREGQKLIKNVRDSDSISKVLVEEGLQLLSDQNRMSISNAKLADIILDVTSCLANENNYCDVNLFDSISGNQILPPKHLNIENDKYAQALLQNDGASIESLLNIIESNLDIYPNSTIKKALDTLKRIALYSPTIAQKICQKNGVSRILQYYKDLKEIKGLEYDNIIVSSEDFKEITNNLLPLLQISEGYDQFVRTETLDEVIKKIENTAFDSAIKDNSNEFIDLSQSLKVIENLSHSSADKTELIDKNAPQAVLSLLKNLNQYLHEDIKSNPGLLEIFSQVSFFY